MKSLITSTCLVTILFLAVPASIAGEESYEILYLEPDRQPSDPQAEDPSPSDIPQLHSQKNSRGKLYDQWFLYRGNGSKKNPEKGNHQFRDLVLTFLREGLMADRQLAGALTYEGFRALEEGNTESARTHFRRALTLDSKHRAARIGMSRVSRQKGGELISAIQWRLLAANPLDRDWRETATLLANISLIVGVAVCIGCPLLVLILFLRHHRRWRHDLYESLKIRTSNGVAGLLSLALLAIPAFLWLGPGWLLVYWLVALFPYFQKTERVLSVVSLLVLALMFPAQDLFRSFSAFRVDPEVQGVIALADGGFSPRSIASVRGIVGDSNQSPELQALLAQTYSDGGYANEAYAQYQHILEGKPGSAWVYNNLGNLYLKSQQYGSAVQQYRKAIEIDPLLVESHYNLHLVYLEQFNLVEAEESLRRAQQIDPKRVPVLVELGKKEPWMTGVLLPQDIRPSWPRLVVEIWDRRPWDPFPEEAATSVSWNRPLTIGGAIGLFAMGFGWVLRRKRLARKCVKCGRAFCRRCQKGLLRDFCSQCHNVFMVKDSLPVPARTAKMQEIARFETWDRMIRRYLSVILPGGGHLYGGRTVVGVGLLAAWTIGWTIHGFRPFLFPVTEVPYILSRPWGGFLTIAILTGTWLLANLTTSTRQA